MSFGANWIFEKAIAAWSCRAIFKPYYGAGKKAEHPLDILWDRQGGKNIEGEDNELWKKIAGALNSPGGILSQLQQWSHDFSPDSNEVLLKHFVCPWDASLVLVAHGSPNGSYGYFYFAVNLMRKEDAPVEKKTQDEESRATWAIRRQEAEERERQYEAQQRRDRQLARERNVQLKMAHDVRFHGIVFCCPGETLEVGAGVVVEANQADRDAIVRAICDNEAVVEYWMPSGRRFLRIIDVNDHSMVRTLSSMKKLPKKWNLQLV